jgi:hypothetical protein
METRCETARIENRGDESGCHSLVVDPGQRAKEELARQSEKKANLLADMAIWRREWLARKVAVEETRRFLEDLRDPLSSRTRSRNSLKW